ncbi:MAG: iscA [Francisellaceae bacterium]|nr:iscA [Francisellaceae bacterium]
MDLINFTSNAIDHIKKTLQSNPQAYGVRLGIKDAGCSGKAYVFDLALTRESDDELIEKENIKILIKNQDLKYLSGTEVDYLQNGLNGQIQFNNPNVKSQCGCGESFNIEK